MINEKYYNRTKEYLKIIDEVIAKGPYTDTWESLSDYDVPKWYSNAKFGIFIHWGVYSVPAYCEEWYPMWMYDKNNTSKMDKDVYEHHVKKYGEPKDFGYKDFIPMFKGEKFDPKEWVDLFKQAGAKYIMPVAEHHDGFMMYDSELSNYTAKNMGPCRDVVGELKAEAEKNDLVFSASNHRMEHLWYFGSGLEYESDVLDDEYNMLYGGAYGKCINQLGDRGSIDFELENEDFMEDWLARNCEFVDNYRPSIVYFDWWIQNKCAKPYLKKFAAFYYNRAEEWGMKVAINSKYDAYIHTSTVFDIERGQMQSIRPRLWQTCTAIGKNSWGYTEGNEYKTAPRLVCDLVDTVSKNGVMLLNVGPKADGTITDEEKDALVNIGKWLKVYGEGIYDSTYWKVYGEGPTKTGEGFRSDTNREEYTSEDIRYTYKRGYLYAFVMKAPKNGIVRLKNLKKYKYMDNAYQGLIESIELMEYDNKFSIERLDEYMEITISGEIKTHYPICFKFKLL